MHSQNQSAPHVSTATYWKVGGILAVLTALEVAVIYIDALQGILGFLLVLIGLLKFLLVAMYFMHLKFDTPVYARFFAFGFVLAVVVMLAVIAIMTNDRLTTELLRG